MLYVRPEIWEALQQLERVQHINQKLMPFVGVPVQVSHYLPETVKDKDGNDVQLFGMYIPDLLGTLDGKVSMQMFTGDVVKKAQPGESLIPPTGP